MLQGNYAYYVTGGSTPIDKLYFSHNGLVEQGQLTKAGELVVAAFERNGVVINWDRTNTHSVVILMLDSVYHRTPHEQGLIVNDLMAKYDLTAEELLNPNYAIQRANWRVYDKGISPYLFELEYTDEKIDAMASNIAEGKQAVQKQHEYRDEQLRLADEQLAINGSHELEITSLMPEYTDTDRLVEWIRLRYPQQRFTGDRLMTLINLERQNHKGTYNNREEVVNALEASVIWNLPNWVSIDYREALDGLSKYYLISQVNDTYYVWDKVDSNQLALGVNA
jgi:hypothetical protein